MTVTTAMAKTSRNTCLAYEVEMHIRNISCEKVPLFFQIVKNVQQVNVFCYDNRKKIFTIFAIVKMLLHTGLCCTY